jgi:hypothetical protein
MHTTLLFHNCAMIKERESFLKKLNKSFEIFENKRNSTVKLRCVTQALRHRPLSSSTFERHLFTYNVPQCKHMFCFSDTSPHSYTVTGKILRRNHRKKDMLQGRR